MIIIYGFRSAESTGRPFVVFSNFIFAASKWFKDERVPMVRVAMSLKLRFRVSIRNLSIRISTSQFRGVEPSLSFPERFEIATRFRFELNRIKRSWARFVSRWDSFGNFEDFNEYMQMNERKNEWNNRHVR